MATNWTQLRQSLIGDREESVLPPNIKLPILPSALLEFNRKAEDPRIGPPELGRTIETDSGLTAELLRCVNSAAIGLRSRTSTAQQAIARLGVRPVKLLLLSAGVERAMKSCRSKLINIPMFWHTNLERAIISRQVAGLLRADSDLAFAGSMLHDFLLPVLTNERFEEYLKFVETAEKNRRPLIDFERETFGWDHCLATAQVLMAWQFPDDLICAVLLHHQGLAILSDPELGRTAIAAVAVAGLVPDALCQSRDGIEQLRKLQEIWPAFDLSTIASTAAQQLAETSPVASQYVTLQRRLEKLAGVSVAR